MPKINIYEQDLTTAGELNASNNVVYVPGFSKYIKEKYVSPSSKDYIKWPHLFRNVSEFKEVFSNDEGKFEYIEFNRFSYTDENNIKSTLVNVEKSMQYALALLSVGLPVLYDCLFHIYDNAITEEDLKAKMNDDSVKKKLDALKDKNNYNIKFITTGGYANTDKINDLLGVAQSRGDCIALIDHEEMTSPYAIKGTDYKFPIESITNGTYGTMFTPWCNFNLPSHQSFTVGKADLPTKLNSINMPGSLAYLLAFGTSISNNNPDWLAAAGATRGVIPYLNAPLVDLSEAYIDKYALTDYNYVGIAINPIVRINPYGVIVWGNRTLHRGIQGLIASSFLNIRHLTSDIKKVIYVACKSLTFEQNSDILWIKFKSLVTPLLDQMQTSDGISGYELRKKKSGKKATLTATIRIYPVEAVEDFEITVELADESTAAISE